MINAASIALGRTGDARAWLALSALRHHPSWKNQCLISALAGLRERGDARGADLALEALDDMRSARRVLATAVWDYPLAAAQTLGDEGARPAFAAVRARFGADASALEAMSAQEAVLEQALAAGRSRTAGS